MVDKKEYFFFYNIQLILSEYDILVFLTFKIETHFFFLYSSLDMSFASASLSKSFTISLKFRQSAPAILLHQSFFLPFLNSPS